MTEEKFKKAIAIKENLKRVTDALNLLKGGCDVILKTDDTVIEITDSEVKKELSGIFSSKVDRLQMEFGWL